MRSRWWTGLSVGAVALLFVLAGTLASSAITEVPARSSASRGPQTSHVGRRAIEPPGAHISRTSAAHTGTAGRGPASLALPAGVSEVTQTMVAGGVARTYNIFRPSAAAAATKLPAIVVLHGRDVTLALEVARDGLLPLVAAGKAVVVYPIGYGRSWNAGVCCGVAQLAGINDVAFVSRVVTVLAGTHGVGEVTLAGFSNGGRMAYRMVCTDPGLVKTFVVVDGVPSTPCAAGRAVSLLQVDGTADTIINYDGSRPPKVFGTFVEPSATAEVAAWLRRDGCTGASANRQMGTLQVSVWAHCAGGTAVQFDTYVGFGHGWPPGGPGTPSAADQLWAFVTHPRGIPAPGTLTPQI